MADLTDVQSALTVKLTGANPSTGVEDNFVEVDSSGRITVKLNDGSGASINLGQTTMTSSVPVVIASNQTALPMSNFPTTVDTNYGIIGASSIRVASQIGNATGGAAFGAGTTTAQVLRVVFPTDQTNIPFIQGEKISSNNSSIANLAAAATFTGTSENALGYASIEVSFKADQQCTIQVEQSTDNSNWDYVNSYVVAASTGDSRTFKLNANYCRVLVTNNGGSTTTFLRLQSIVSPIGETLPTALTGGAQLKAADVIDTSSTHVAISVTTSASEAKVGASKLLNRKMVSITPTNGTIYWGSTNAVTTSSGTPIFKNQTATFSFTDNVAVWLIAGSTIDVRIVEAS